MTDIDFEVKKLNLKSDDVVVFKINTNLPKDKFESIAKLWKGYLGTIISNKVLFLTKEMEISVLSPEENEDK